MLGRPKHVALIQIPLDKFYNFSIAAYDGKIAALAFIPRRQHIQANQLVMLGRGYIVKIRKRVAISKKRSGNF